MAVDINGRADFTGTTDEFFDSIQVPRRWDIIFIDANHDYEYVLRDFNNSIQYANDWVILHDMIPPTARHTEKRFCSDGYKFLYRLKTETDYEVFPMLGNAGLTFVRIPQLPARIKPKVSDLMYFDFMIWLAGIRLYAESEIIFQLAKVGSYHR